MMISRYHITGAYVGSTPFGSLCDTFGVRMPFFVAFCLGDHWDCIKWHKHIQYTYIYIANGDDGCKIVLRREQSLPNHSGPVCTSPSPSPTVHDESQTHPMIRSWSHVVVDYVDTVSVSHNPRVDVYDFAVHRHILIVVTKNVRRTLRPE
jgi:hypothetical protein